MDRLMMFEMPINVSSRYILYFGFSSSLSNLLFSELSNTILQIEEEIGNDTDKKRSDEKNEKIEINDKIGNIYVYKQSRDRKYYNKRRKFQTVVNVLYRVR